ncbi:MAG: hypothetical protein LH478_06810 [Chitinophagaceae bacterium]|nr:hypothetical protein [Chitinophagaceae bacterium]
MTPFSKSVRSSIVLALFLTVAFVQNTSAQADARYQYQQRNNGTAPTANTAMETADKKKAPLVPTQTIPFDGGLSLFVLAGAGIAAKKRYDKRKAQA